MFDVVATVLAYFYDLTQSYGGAIMLLTLAIMLLLTPLTLKGTRSMIAMQRLQPEMKKLQTRYKDDRQKLNEEMLKFYKEHNINPVGGCLPLLIQMPVFFVLYRVLIGLTDRAPYGEPMGRAFGLAGGDPEAVFDKFGTFKPQHIEGTKMFEDLSNVNKMKSFGLDLADSASNVISDGMGRAVPYLVLIALIGVTAWFQQKQVQGRNPQAQAQINPQQQMIMKIMPFFLPVISFGLPAGVTLYFLVSNVYRIGQQAFITRTMYGDGAGHALPIDTTSTETAPPRKGMMAQLKALTEGGATRAGPKETPSKSTGKGAKPAPGRGSAKGAPAKGPSSKKPASKATASRPAVQSDGTNGSEGEQAPVAPRGGGRGPVSRKSKTRQTRTNTPEPLAPPKAAQGEPTDGDERRSKSVAARNGPDPATRPAAATGKAVPPSRRPPAPGPNRSRAKKKRK